MPLPTPKSESKKDFISSCMSDLSKEFPDSKQRAAVCYDKWEEKKSKASIIIEDGEEELVFGNLEDKLEKD